jgi:hypothetical protein
VSVKVELALGSVVVAFEVAFAAYCPVNCEALAMIWLPFPRPPNSNDCGRYQVRQELQVFAAGRISLPLTPVAPDARLTPAKGLTLHAEEAGSIDASRIAFGLFNSVAWISLHTSPALDCHCPPLAPFAAPVTVGAGQ